MNDLTNFVGIDANDNDSSLTDDQCITITLQMQTLMNQKAIEAPEAKKNYGCVSGNSNMSNLINKKYDYIRACFLCR